MHTCMGMCMDMYKSMHIYTCIDMYIQMRIDMLGKPTNQFVLPPTCVCARARVRACVRACVLACRRAWVAYIIVAIHLF